LNDNPTAQQFEAAYKRLLFHSDLVQSAKGNRTVQDDTSLLSVSKNDGKQHNYVPILTEQDSYDFSYEYDIIIEALSEYKQNATYYIAGFITKNVHAMNAANCY
jgi:hypothetical protein